MRRVDWVLASMCALIRRWVWGTLGTCVFLAALAAVLLALVTS